MYLHLTRNTLDFPVADPVSQLIRSFDTWQAPLWQRYFLPSAHPPLQNLAGGVCYALLGESQVVALLPALASCPLYLEERGPAGQEARSRPEDPSPPSRSPTSVQWIDLPDRGLQPCEGS